MLHAGLDIVFPGSGRRRAIEQFDINNAGSAESLLLLSIHSLPSCMLVVTVGEAPISLVSEGATGI